MQVAEKIPTSFFQTNHNVINVSRLTIETALIWYVTWTSPMIFCGTLFCEEHFEFFDLQHTQRQNFLFQKQHFHNFCLFSCSGILNVCFEEALKFMSFLCKLLAF